MVFRKKVLLWVFVRICVRKRKRWGKPMMAHCGVKDKQINVMETETLVNDRWRSGSWKSIRTPNNLSERRGANEIDSRKGEGLRVIAETYMRENRWSSRSQIKTKRLLTCVESATKKGFFLHLSKEKRIKLNQNFYIIERIVTVKMLTEKKPWIYVVFRTEKSQRKLKLSIWDYFDFTRSWRYIMLNCKKNKNFSALCFTKGG